MLYIYSGLFISVEFSNGLVNLDFLESETSSGFHGKGGSFNERGGEFAQHSNFFFFFFLFYLIIKK
jgi:hypothetical protein